MPKYRITSPDGKTFEITAPEGATQEQALAYAQQQFSGAQKQQKGLLQAGNIDLNNRPVVRNADGTISTVRSMSANFDGREVLIPTVSEDGRIMSEDEAIATYRNTGRHLGMFDTPANATAYAESLHNQQAEQYGPSGMVDTDFGPRPANEVFDMGAARQQEYEQRLAANEARQPSDPMHPSNNPTTGMGQWERGAAAFGKSLIDTGRGIKQLFGGYSQQDVANDRQADAPLMGTGAGKTGYVLGQVGQMLVPLGTGAKVASVAGRATPFINAAIQGGAFNGLQPVGAGESRTMNTATGAALGVAGQGVAKGAGVLATRARNAMNPVVRESIELAKGAGIPLHASQVTGSKALKATSSALNYLPLSGAGKAGAKQQEAFNAAVARSFGADAKVLSDDAMKAARARLSNEYTDIFKGKHIAVSEAPVRRWNEIVNDAADNLVGDEAAVVSKQFDKILRKAEDGAITGEQYQALRTSLSDAIDGGKTGRYVKQMRGVLDEIAGIGLGPRDSARLVKARGQWANMRTTEDALKQVSGASGNIKPASLWPLVRNGSTREMRELAKIGQNVLKDTIPDSGTPVRELVYRTMGMGGAAGAASAAGLLAPLAKGAIGGATLARMLNTPAAARALEQGVPTAALARLLQPAPRALPLLTPAVVQATEKKKNKR